MFYITLVRAKRIRKFPNDRLAAFLKFALKAKKSVRIECTVNNSQPQREQEIIIAMVMRIGSQQTRN